MSESIHAHAVMELMIENGGSFTQQSLLELLQQQFGMDARFHTCKAQDKTAAEIIEFLEARGKFIASDAGFNTSSDKICSHSH
ncbi:DUF2492 family protein [Alginatibacterium sediminis]|uniref:DUF2492 family protein n=2 Tax=Alginatibacterium sediminis TaxID=2164068 RepID=A0A420ELU2_9ALTE|nr:YecH family metal-binding protein [Alginatibacterium sediminis]RKF21574.1 DUF2492 family protein [Alginatibacterium sediminis]